MSPKTKQASQFTAVQLSFLENARRIAPVALDRTAPLYRFMRYANPREQQCVHEALIQRQFRFGRPRAFNDPFDCRPHLRLPGWIPWFQRRWYVRASLQLVRKRFPGDAAAEQRARADLASFDPEQLVADTEASVRDGLLDTQRILCLCGNQKHVLMWAYYADGHHGVAIHMSPHIWPIAAGMRVAYSNRYPTIPLSILEDDRELVRQFVLKKAKAWRHEAEYRVLVQDEDPQRFGIEWLSADTARFPAGAVTGITVGSLMKGPTVQRIVAAARAAIPAVPVFRAITQRRRFRLEFEPIP